MKYAIEHADTDPRYKWINTKQPEDLNFDTYLKIQRSKTGKITLKSIHKDYRLQSTFICGSNIYVTITPKNLDSGLLDMELETTLILQ